MSKITSMVGEKDQEIRRLVTKARESESVYENEVNLLSSLSLPASRTCTRPSLTTGPTGVMDGCSAAEQSARELGCRHWQEQPAVDREQHADGPDQGTQVPCKHVWPPSPTPSARAEWGWSLLSASTQKMDSMSNDLVEKTHRT